MAEDIEPTMFMDRTMSEVFDWSDDSTPVRDALWDYFMENDGHDTDKTEADMQEMDAKTDAEIEAFINENLKK
ncbi:P8 family protein [Levilactobacillus bambusae]|uniref:Uncharacterized protein n=1 Tax=Levilactobacillus bambusae TaxID=2024736 RepID=A0A2V1MYU0_9LACO|nr:hypothetical protein [Levilactobacillus bambusae]PWG00139.1 hypothetical protein DCM90_04175 [Levilactobacillus bambusae]